MNWYINKKTNELVQAIWEEDVNGKDYSCWFVYKDGRKIAELNVADFQSQYGEAMICPDRIKCTNEYWCDRHHLPHICNNIHFARACCPDCIPYIPEQKQADEEPVFPICGTCNARKDAYLLLPPEKIRDILQTGGTPEDFSIETAKAELDHLAKLGIVYVKANDSSPVIEGNKDIIPVAEGYGFQISTVEEEAELGKKLISQEEYEECGDDEDMLIAQHNKTVKDMLAAGYKKFIPLSDYMKGE